MYTTTTNNTMLFCDYYKQWITVYKEGAIRPVTMSKYNMAHQWLEKLIPNLDRKSTRLNSSHRLESRMPSSA